MSATVELGEKGRELIPAEIRKEVRSRRFKVSTRRTMIEVEGSSVSTSA
jgi:hypothetical protein